jgi:hypothetical protein
MIISVGKYDVIEWLKSSEYITLKGQASVKTNI